jgi:3-hydroxybutyryl-CoA dehydratase
MDSRYWEDFEAGARYPTASRLVTDADHLQFCKLVSYDVPLFLDEAYARTTSFGGRICPSALVMAFSTAMTGRLFRDTIIAQLTIENGRFLAPVRPGDTIRTEVEVVEKKPTTDPARGYVLFRDHVYNQHGDEVFRADKAALIRRRAAK